ncbi:Pelle [Gryllus bimaculatus]|nr:Pelle [Gryllus bimaculatus]
MDGNLPIRKVPPKALYELVQILECENDWKKLMCIVPKNFEDTSLKYNIEHVKQIEDASGYQRRPCAEIFLEEWSTSGRKQPTLQLLLHLLKNAELFRAAEYVAVQLLKESAPERPKTGPAAYIDVSEKNIQHLIDARQEEKKMKKSVLYHNENKIYESFTVNSGSKMCANANESIEKTNATVIKSEQLSLAISNETDHVDSISISDNAKPDEDSINSNHSTTYERLHNTNLEHISYVELERCTNYFCELPVIPGKPDSGGKLGTGAFGSVYLGVLLSLKVAVKRLKNDAVSIEKQFKNEVETLSKYQHENLLPLLRYSCDGPHYCLVYAYMSNGSLQDRLACQGSTPILPWQERLNIAHGTSKGILHLHTAYEKPLIHRDIKSANILLDDHLVPKLGDFGLVRLGPSGQQSQSVAQTTTVFGTSAYMAREAFWGDISVKLDSFSFGVVLLELLTSLPSYDENREGRDLITHVEDSCEKSIKPLLDYRAGKWLINENQDISDSVYTLALECLKERRQSRPDMRKIVEELENLMQLLSNS